MIAFTQTRPLACNARISRYAAFVVGGIAVERAPEPA
jgi:hypothetical protein